VETVVEHGFWSGKRVLVTGHTGFKGAWLSLWLQRLGAEVSGFALAAPTVPSLYELVDVGKNMRSVDGDIRDEQHLKAAFRALRPEIIFHMAAQSLVRPSYEDPLGTYATNVMGTINLLEAVRQSDHVQAVVVVTSDKCYENREWVWGYRESDGLGGYDPYSSSKACAELVTLAFRRSFFSGEGAHDAVATVRAGNVIGGGDWARDRVVPDIIRAALSGEPLRIRNPSAERPWQYVLEPLRGYLMLAEKLCREGKAYADSWNFGPADHDVKPVSWVVNRIAELWHAPVTVHMDESAQPHEARNLRLDCSKAARSLSWRGCMSSTDALKATVAWYETYEQAPEILRDFTLQQLKEYHSIATS
jgi:CDP-glucose 4,6-dehydratase